MSSYLPQVDPPPGWQWRLGKWVVSIQGGAERFTSSFSAHNLKTNEQNLTIFYLLIGEMYVYEAW